ncbi:unnamed protein product [Calypogeia fissa]
MARGPSFSRALCLLLFVVALFSNDAYVDRFSVGAQVLAGGSWQLLANNVGIASMHTSIDLYGQAIFLDRTDAGPSLINLTDCSGSNCSAHSVLFTPVTGTVRPLTVLTNTWCSSGQFVANGTIVQTGGSGLGGNKIRYFEPCPPGGTCDWTEDSTQFLQQPRWYATDQVLPDGRMIVIGGLNAFSVEFVPDNGEGLVPFPFLFANQDSQGDNLYPYVHLLPDGNLYIFCNKASILYNYINNTILRTYPNISGEPRSYPSAGSSVLLPLQFTGNFAEAEVLVCGGAQYGAFTNPGAKLPASSTCGRLRVTDPAPIWIMEAMPMSRCMGDMVLLPTGSVLIINGAQAGSQGFNNAFDPALSPVLYQPDAPLGLRFSILNATTIPRMYHSTANLLPDGRILVAGSNPNNVYTFTPVNPVIGQYPTELRVEAFSPPYLAPSLAFLTPSFISVPTALLYNQAFGVVISLGPGVPVVGAITLTLMSAPFATHSFSQGQRMLVLGVTSPVAIGNNEYQIASISPPNSVLAPAGYYMLFAVNQGVPSVGAWVQISP